MDQEINKVHNDVEVMQETMSELMGNEDFKNMWIKMHTPYRSKSKLSGHKVGRNEICPYCTSGKKFKNCKCYNTYKNEPFITGEEARNIDEQLMKIK